MPDLRLTAGSGELRAYLALPIGPSPHPGVIVIQDALGLSDDIREQADKLAAAGCLALAPDLYTGRGIRCVIATMRASRSGGGPAYHDIEAARALLAAREDCTGRIGTIGFCMGGRLRAAVRATRIPGRIGELRRGPRSGAARRPAGAVRDVTLRAWTRRLGHAGPGRPVATGEAQRVSLLRGGVRRMVA
jgi:carboxymethylenebutenolidase